MKKSRSPTVHDIAEAAGVSIATVSQVLNDRGQRFRPETRERVWQVALAAGYRPNPAAKALRSGRLGAVGLVIGDRSESHLPDSLLRGLATSMLERGGQLVVAPLDESGGEQLADLERRLGVDGLLINLHQHFGAALLRQRRAVTLPTVWMNADLPTACVGPDDVAAGRQACAGLIAQGYRDICWVDVLHHGSEPHHSVARRESGYAAAMSDAGLAPRRLVAPQVFTPSEARRWLHTQWREQCPEAVVGYSFHTAVAVDGVGGHAVESPVAMAVIVDEPLQEHALEAVAVELPWRRVAVAALDELVAQLAGSPPAPSVLIS